MEQERSYLDGAIMLSRNESSKPTDKFTIRSVIGEGSSSICYEAIRKLEDGSEELGKLKEFYPVDSIINNKILYFSMIRCPDGQLIAESETTHKFDKLRSDYINTHRLLHKVIVDNPKNEILKSYIQHNEVFYGYVDTECGKYSMGDNVPKKEKPKPTVYIWSPSVPGKRFDFYLSEIRKSPHKSAEKNLRNILCVIDTLTDCIKALHTAGLIHMDIKPSNFLVQYDTDDRIMPNNISLFDINSLCSVESELFIPFGTPGFCAPEIKNGKASNRSDIYSIGAMLFNALVITEDIPDGLYRDVFHPSIPLLIKNSELFKCSDVNSDSVLMLHISKILEKCLAPNPKRRYECCSDLKEEIERVIQRLDSLIAYASAYRDKVGITEPTIVIQKLLYDYPLYEGISDSTESKNINVLLLGSGTYGQKFIDICMQSGQMYGYDLSIDAVSNDADENRESYIRFRPAIKEFINIDGCLDGEKDMAYANLNFKNIGNITNNEYFMFTKRNTQVNRDIINNILKSKKSNFNYVFIALGDDKLNKAIANICSENMEYSCPVCYISESQKKISKKDIANKCYPVFINEAIDITAMDELGEMAFNTHSIWNRAINTNTAKERENFFTSNEYDDRYNRIASLAFVLSIKYKLYSINIKCNDIEQAVKEFSELMANVDSKNNREAHTLFSKLVYLEHKRWVLEKVCNGWTAPRGENGSINFEGCIARGKIRDNKNMTHPCIVHSSENFVLDTPEYTADNHKKWNIDPIDSRLDELDTMSLQLHRFLKGYAETLRNDGTVGKRDIEIIQAMIPKECEYSEKTFKQFCFALKNILNGSEGYSRQYNYYQDMFLESLNDFGNDNKNKIKERMAVIKKEYFPIIESNLYRDYKKNDEILIRKIPFILTYRYKPFMAAVFEDGKYQNGRNEAIFSNVAAATLLSPKRLCYLYYFEKNSSADLFIHKLDAVINYLKKRKICCEVEIIIACLQNDTVQKDIEQLQNGLNRLENVYSKSNENPWLKSYYIHTAENNEDISNYFADYLVQNKADLYNGNNSLFSDMYDSAVFINKIIDMGIPYFELDCRNKIFTKHIGCDYLRFAESSAYIRIQDIFALMKAEDTRFNIPELSEDYKLLWDIYTGSYVKNKDSAKRFELGIGNWNYICGLLADYEKQRRPLASITIDANKYSGYKTITYILPEFAFSTAKNLTYKLKQYGILQESSDLSVCASDSFRLEWKTDTKYVPQLKAVLDRYDIFLPHYEVDAVKFTRGNAECVNIIYNDPNVINLDIDPENRNFPIYSYDMLKKLDEHNFIRLTSDNDINNCKKVSFVYSSNHIKKLLTSAGEILEIYAYYEARKTGYFDDLASGYEFSWESGGVKNELDLVLTKGFKSIFVECKAVVSLKLDYYHKLHSIADHFGIGNTKVLIGNTYKQSIGPISESNEMQRSRGNQLNIITVSDRESILNIGQTLVKIMESC